MLRGCLGGAMFLGVAFVGSSQEFRVLQSTPWAAPIADITSNGSQIRFLWNTELVCSGLNTPVTRAMDATGKYLEPELPVTQDCGLSSTYIGSVAVLPDGRFAAAWELGSSGCVYGRTFDAFGNPLSAEFCTNPGDEQYTPDLLAHPDGHFLLAWAGREGTVYTVKGRVVLPDGTMPGPVVRLPDGPLDEQSRGRLGMFGDGEVVAVWADMEGNLSRVMERRFAPDLAPLSGSVEISQTRYRWGNRIGLGVSGTEYVVAWDRGNPTDTYARRFNKTTGPLADEFLVNTYTSEGQSYPNVAIDASGYAVITWASRGQIDPSTEIYGQRLNPVGDKWGPEFRVNLTTDGNQNSPHRLAMLDNGDFVSGYSSGTGAGYLSLPLARRFSFPVSLLVGQGTGAPNLPEVSFVRPDGRQDLPTFSPYGTGGYGATTGAGDLDGNGFSEALTGPGPSPVFGPHVRAYDWMTIPISKVNYFAYGTLRFGVKPGSGDIDGDGFDEILTTPGPGEVFGPHVRGWNYDGVKLSADSRVSFFAFQTLKYGANGSTGDVDGDGVRELLAAPGPSPTFGAQIRGFDYDGATVRAMGKINFYAFPGITYGATVTAADIESDGWGGYGDGFDEIACAMGAGPVSGGDFRILDFDGSQIQTRLDATAPYGTNYGLNIAGGDVDAGDTEELVTAPGPDPAAPSRVLCWEVNPKIGINPDGETLQRIETDDFEAFPGQAYGATVAIGAFE